MPGTRRTAMNVSLFRGATKFLDARSFRDVANSGSEGLENRIEPLHGFFRAADHHAVAALQTPYAAAGPDIHIVNTLCGAHLRTADIIFEIRVAAVDDCIPSLHEREQGLHSGLGRIARSN